MTEEEFAVLSLSFAEGQSEMSDEVAYLGTYYSSTYDTHIMGLAPVLSSTKLEDEKIIRILDQRITIAFSDYHYDTVAADVENLNILKSQGRLDGDLALQQILGNYYEQMVISSSV